MKTALMLYTLKRCVKHSVQKRDTMFKNIVSSQSPQQQETSVQGLWIVSRRFKNSKSVAYIDFHKGGAILGEKFWWGVGLSRVALGATCVWFSLRRAMKTYQQSLSFTFFICPTILFFITHKKKTSFAFSNK